MALATILDAAGVSWGILGKDEKCCGDSLRRLGNEFVFDKMARENVELFQEKGVTKVITQCPHCFSTLKNDYRQYGLELEVIHHSELIDELLASGRLKLNRQVTELGKIVFHDSCYLGRHNDVYEAPREVHRRPPPARRRRRWSATGRTPSAAAPAAGGCGWRSIEGSRINLNRVEEALREQRRHDLRRLPLLHDHVRGRPQGQAGRPDAGSGTSPRWWPRGCGRRHSRGSSIRFAFPPLTGRVMGDVR